MDALVLELRDEPEVVDLVVELVPVDVVDVVSGWDSSPMLSFPDVDVLHDLPATDADSAVALCCD